MIVTKNFYTNCHSLGDDIVYRGVKDNNRVMERIQYSPTLFLPTRTSSKFKTLFGRAVEPMNFSTMTEARKFLDRYKEVENFQIYGNVHFHFCYLSDLFRDTIEYDLNQIKVAVIDIEVGSDNGFPEAELANEPVTAITVKIDNVFYVFSCGEFKSKYIKKEDPDIEYCKCENERDLLSKFLDFWQKNYPDIITGWNVAIFDIPYLVNRISKVLSEDQSKKLSPWKKFSRRTITLRGKLHETFSILGISILDYWELYLKYSPNPSQESYKLDYIANVELGIGKVQFEGNLRNLYKDNFQKFIEYNIRDVELVAKLEEKLRLIELVIILAYDSRVNYDDVLSQVRSWDTLIFNELRKQHIVVPPKKSVENEQSFAGAYVKEPTVGLHRWISCFDAASLYPSLIRALNISPETIVEDEFQQVSCDELLAKTIDTGYLKEKDITLAANGHHFQRSPQGILPQIIEKMYKERQEYKAKKIKAEKELEVVKKELKRRHLA